MTMLSPYAAYQQALAAGFKNDTAQYQAALGLQRCYEQLQAGGPDAQGVYLWGPVGRGKTWLMDRFHQALTVPSKRQHFHHFIRWVHRRFFQLTGQEEPLYLLVQELAAEARVLCLDELSTNCSRTASRSTASRCCWATVTSKWSVAANVCCGAAITICANSHWPHKILSR